jgi:uncharacterized protein
MYAQPRFNYDRPKPHLNSHAVRELPMRTAPGPLSSTERAIAPDLARGAMLLFIGLANSSGYAAAATIASTSIQALERGVDLVLLTFVHARAYAVFAIMFGYSLVQLARRQETAGASRTEVRCLLLRRNVWLIVFGFFHAALLYFADFLAAYGIIGILATFLLLYRERVQRVVLWLWGISLLELVALVAYVAYRWTHGTGAEPQPPSGADSSMATNYMESILTRLNEWPLHTATVIPAIFIVCLGMWAANRRLLEDIGAHRSLLRKVALVCLPIAFLGGLPLALADVDVVHVDEETFFAMDLLHKVSGMFGGPGYVAVVGLLAGGVHDGSGWTGRIMALGRRSLSGYLFQSFAWLMLLSPFTLYLGGTSGAPLATAAVLAIAVWTLSVCAAGWMEHRAYRGPAESLLRRLTYRAPVPGARHLSRS